MSQIRFPRHDESFTSVIATPDLVGRRDELRQMYATVEDRGQDYIVCITGRGGIGKTVLVRNVLNHFRDHPYYWVAKGLIDLYHTRHRTPDGLARAIQESLDEAPGDFERYLTARKTLEEYSISPPENAEAIREQRQKTLSALIEDINRISEQNQRRVILGLDTVEFLFHRSDPAQEALGLQTEQSPVQGWLLAEFLPNVKNAVIFVAGRPGPADFLTALKQVPGKQIFDINLAGLTEEASSTYFEKVIQVARSSPKEEDQAVADAIQKLTEEDRKRVFWSLCDAATGEISPRVRPILLSLAISYLVVAGRPFEIFRWPLQALQMLSEQERRENERRLSLELAKAIRESHRPADEVLLALAYTRKGATPELVARIADFRVDEGGWDIDLAERLLTEIRHLSFIKIREADDRIFLHDEMYDLLQYYILDRPEQIVHARRVYEAIQIFYKELIEKARQNVENLFSDRPEEILPLPEDVMAARTVLNDALVEHLSYQLKKDLDEGFSTYYSYAEEAVTANDENLDLQLRVELLTVLSNELRYAGSVGDDRRVEAIEKLRKESVIPDAAIRWVKRLFFRQSYREALVLVGRLRGEAAEFIRPGRRLAEAGLNNWEGLIYAYLGETEKAARLLSDDFIQWVENLQIPPAKLKLWGAVLARAYVNRGYLERVLGNFREATVSYKQAIPYWRFLEMEIAQADTLNNQAYVLGIIGDLADARQMAQAAYDLRQRSGQLKMMVLSLSTLAEIEIYAGNYPDALNYADKALKLSFKQNYRRGEGLAHLSLAILKRFISEPEQKEDPFQRKRLLQEALNHSKAAYLIFTTEIPEDERQVRALIEEGSTLRELYRLSPREYDCKDQAEDRLKEAEKRARQRNNWLVYLDAALSRAWLYYYIKQPDLLDATLRMLKDETESQLSMNLITPDRFPVRRAEKQGVFGQLARMHALYGIRALDRYEDEKPARRSLVYAAQQFVMTFEYDALIGEDFREVRRATNVIKERLKPFSKLELLSIYNAVKESPGIVLPAVKPYEDLLFWRILENEFGPYKVIRLMAG